MKKTIAVFFLLTFTAIFPSILFAVNTPKNFTDVVYIFTDLIRAAIPLVMALALLAFFWGLAKFVLKAGSEEGRKEGKKVMLWGIIVLFVSASIFAILTFFYSEFEFSRPLEFPPRLPTDIIGGNGQ